MRFILFIFFIMNINCIVFKRNNKILLNIFTRLKSANNIYDGNDHRYNITNNLPIKNLKLTNHDVSSFITNNEDIIILSNIGKNIYILKILKKLLNKNVSEIEKLKEIESYEKCIGYTEEESIYKLNLKAGGLLKDWDFDLYMSNLF